MVATAAPATRTVLGRKMASPEAVHRRRLARQYKPSRAQAPAGTRPSPVLASTTLTYRQIIVLKKATDPLFETGILSIRYMGLRYLQLYCLGWTTRNGIKCSDAEFDGVWEWWNDVSVDDREELMELSRECGVPMGAK